jgi:hypothetical protein
LHLDPLDLPSPSVGVGHDLAASAIVGRSTAPDDGLWFILSVAQASGVGQDEESLPLVARSHGSRAEHVPFRIKPARSQVSEYVSKPSSKEAWDVLQEDEARSHLANDSGDVGPDPPLVLRSLLLSGDGERLAWKSGSDDIHFSSEERSVKSREVGPYRRVIQDTRFNRRIQTRDCEGFPLHVQDLSSIEASES